MPQFTRFFLPLVLAASLHATPAFLTVLPAPQTANVGQTVEVSILINNVVDLSAWQIDVGFDPTILTATAVNYDFFLGANQGVLIPTIDNAVGLISSLGAYQSAGTGIAGTGRLVSIQFTAIAPGVSSVSPFNVILLDSTFGDIPATELGPPPSVTVQATTNAVPEPATLWIQAAALGIIVYRRRTRGAGFPPAPYVPIPGRVDNRQ